MKKIIVIITAMVMIFSISACGNKENNHTEEKNKAGTTEKMAEQKKFPKFTGSDFKGKKVDNSMLKENSVTVFNFWFNGCTACVEEMSDLEEFNKELKKRDATLVGVNVEANYSEDTLKEAKEILKAKGVTYSNIMFNEGKEADDYLKNIMAFPTTVLVDKKGNIIGEPIAGNINNDETLDDILKTIEEHIEKTK